MRQARLWSTRRRMIAVVILLAAAVLPVELRLPVEAQDTAAAPAQESGARPPVEVGSEVQLRPELEDISGVQRWRVNGQEITLDDVTARALLFQGPYVLQDVLAATLLEQEAKRRGLSVTEEEVEVQIGALREQLGLRSEHALDFHLRQRRMTREGFRQQAREYLLLTKVLGDRVYVSDAEVGRFYREFGDVLYSRGERVAFRIISFNTEDAARAALQEMSRGKNFVEVARAQALSPAERAVAGELNWYERGQQPAFPPDFEAVLFAAQLNQAVGPIKAVNRYHLVRVEKKSDPYQLTLEEVRENIRAQLRRRDLEQVVWPRWIGAQLANAEIEVIGAEGGDTAGPEPRSMHRPQAETAEIQHATESQEQPGPPMETGEAD